MSQNPSNETSNTAEGSASAPSTPSTPGTKKSLRELAAEGQLNYTYSPKSPSVAAPDQTQQQTQQMLGMYQNAPPPRYAFYPPPTYGYQVGQPYYAPAQAYSYSPQVNPAAIYVPGNTPTRPVQAMPYPMNHPSMNPHAPPHVPSNAKGPAPASPATAPSSASTTTPSGETVAPVVANGIASTPATSNTTTTSAPNGTDPAPAKATAAATPASTTASTTPVSATTTPSTTTPLASTPNASTVSSLMIPKDTRSALNTSTETGLQPPIKKAKASAAAPATTSPKPEDANKDSTPATTTTEDAKSAVKTPEPVKAAEPVKIAEPPKATSPAPVLTAAEVVKAAAANAAAKEAAAKEAAAKEAAAKEAAAKATAAPKTPNSLKESFDVNFEVEDHLKKPTTPAKSPIPAKSPEPKPEAATPKTAAALVAAAAAAANASSAPVDAANPASDAKTPSKAEAKSENGTTTAPLSAATHANGAPSTPAKSAPVTPVSTPQPYKVTAQDQLSAKKSDGVAGPPPGLLTYTAEQLMAFSVVAKSNPVPSYLQRALDKTTINSPGGRQPGKGPGGGKGPRGAGRREDKLKQGPPPTVVRPVGIEPGSIEAKSRTFRGILNKITPEKFDKLVGKMLEVPVENPETLAALVDIIADVSVRELKFCAMYASLCAQIAQSLPSFEVVHDNDSKPTIHNFRTVMLTKCQNLFSARHPIKPVPDEIVDPEQRQEWELKQNKIRSNMLGLVKFLGELANQNVLAGPIIPMILEELFTARLGYDDLELYTILLSTYGKQLGSNVHPYLQKCRDWIAEYISREKEKQDSEGTRIRYLMQDTIDLAENNWVHRSVSAAAQGPKTLAEIHDDIARNEAKKEAELKQASKKPYGRGLAQPLPSKSPARGPPPSILQRDAPPRTPSSPSQGGRGKAGFASNALSPARGMPATASSSGMTSPSILSNAFDSLSSESSFDPNFLASSTSSAPADDEPEDMDAGSLDSLVEEFLDSNVADEAVETLMDSPALEESCKYFISRLLLKVLDMTTDKKRDWAIDLLQLFLKSDYNMTETDRFVVPGLTQTVAELDSIDLPKAPSSLGVIIAECLKRKIVPLHTLNKILAPLQKDSPSRAANVIISMWSHIPPADVPGLLKQTNFNISNWPVPDEKVPAAMKQSLETVESQLARGEDPLKVAVWANANNSSAFKARDFVIRIVRRMTEEVTQLAASSSSSSGATNTLDENYYTPIIKAVLSNGKAHEEIATALVDGFNLKPSLGLPLFTLFNKLGLPKSKIADATSKVGSRGENRYDFDPTFNSWFHSGGGAGPAAKSSSKSSKGGKSKAKRK